MMKKWISMHFQSDVIFKKKKIGLKTHFHFLVLSSWFIINKQIHDDNIKWCCAFGKKNFNRVPVFKLLFRLRKHFCILCQLSLRQENNKRFLRNIWMNAIQGWICHSVLSSFLLVLYPQKRLLECVVVLNKTERKKKKPHHNYFCNSCFWIGNERYIKKDGCSFLDGRKKFEMEYNDQ